MLVLIGMGTKWRLYKKLYIIGKSSPNISNMKNCTNHNLGEGVWTDLAPFISDPESGVMYWTVSMFMTV